MKTNRKLKKKKQKLHNNKFCSLKNKDNESAGISLSELDAASDYFASKVKSSWENIGVCFPHERDNESFPKLSHEQRLSSKMFRKYGCIERYFHISSPLNWEKIQIEGIKSINVNPSGGYSIEGNIYVVQSLNKEVWNYIGYNQIGCGVVGLRMIVIEIAKQGITGNIFSEEGGEYTTPLHTVIEQDFIDPKYLTKIYEFDTSRTQFYKFRPAIQKLKREFLLRKSKNISNNQPFKNAE